MKEEEERVLAEARFAWDTGEPQRAARIIEAYLARHPGRRAALMEAGQARSTPPPTPEEGDEPVASLSCLRCGRVVPRSGHARLHDGGYLSDVFVSDLFVRRLEVDVYACGHCGHVEFTTPDAYAYGNFGDDARTGAIRPSAP